MVKTVVRRRRSRRPGFLTAFSVLLCLVAAFGCFSSEARFGVMASGDDFADFDSEESSEAPAAEGKAATGGDAFVDFDDSATETVSEDPENVVIDDDYDSEDDDGAVEDVEETKPAAERDDFDFGDEFGDDQIVKTYPGDMGGDGRKVNQKKATQKTPTDKKPNLTFKDVPDHLRNNWKLFYVEGMLIAFILYYVFNFFTGCEKNQKIAKAWFSQNRDYLRTQFHQIGERSEKQSEDESSEVLTAQSHNVFTLWCTGRKGIEGMFIEIRLVPRQDLISMWRNKFNRKRPQTQDTVTFSIYLGEEFTEPVVMTLGKLGAINDLWRQYMDLRTFCQKGPKEKGNILKGYHGCVESMEMMTYLMDAQAQKWYQAKDGCELNYMHISDNYTCIADAEREEEMKDAVVKPRKLMVVGLLLDPNADGEHGSDGFTKGTLYILERLRRLRLSKEVKQSCERRRMKAIEDDQKRQHQSRHAQAAERAEVRRRALTKRIMDESNDGNDEVAKRLQEQLNKKDWKDHKKRMTRGVKQTKVR